MVDQTKSKDQLMEEIKQLRQRVAELEGSISETPSLEQDISQTIIDTSPAFHVIIDLHGKTKMMNKSMLAALGYSEEEIQGKDYLSTFVPARERDQLSALFEQQLLKGKSTINQNYVLTKDGRELLIEWQGHPILNSKNEVESFLGVGLDITMHKAAEDKIRSAKEYAENLIETANAMVIALDTDGNITVFNKAAEEITGYSRSELLNRNWFEVVVPKERYPEVWAEFERLIIGGLPKNFENPILTKSGEERYIVWKNNELKENEQIVGTISFGIDITERKRVEERLQHISQEENKRRKELEKLREISTSMRQAEGSSELLQVFTEEVHRLCDASEVTSSILFKAHQEPVTFLAPEANIKLSREQSEAISSALSNANTGVLTASIPGFESAFVLQLQSADAVHGALLVASRKREVFAPDQQNLLNAAADMAGTALNRIDILETLEERVRQRTRNLIVLYNLITIISENWRLQDLLELSLMLTLETVKADRGIIYLKDEKDVSILKPVIQRGFTEGFQIEVASLPDDALAREVFKKQKPISLHNLDDNPAFAKFKGLTSYAGIPILARGDARGVFSLFANAKDAFGVEEMALLVSIADHLGIGIDNTVLYERSRESAALEERNRLARDLHDSVSQLLYSLTLMSGTTKRMLERGSDLEAVKSSVERLGDTAHRALKEMRLLLFELRPAVLDSEGLINALRHRIKAVEEEVGVNVEFQAKGLPELPNYVEDALYHIAMEALNNIVKHADSNVATIKFTSHDDKLVMEISDQGKGFDTDLLQRGLGLRNMRERGQMLGSEVIIDSKPGEGTRVIVEVKLPSDSLVSS